MDDPQFFISIALYIVEEIEFSTSIFAANVFESFTHNNLVLCFLVLVILDIDYYNSSATIYRNYILFV